MKTTLSAVRLMIETDKKVTYQKNRTNLGIGMSQEHNIFHEYLAVEKLYTRWIPHNLTDAQKHHRVNWYCKLMRRFGGDDSNAPYDIFTKAQAQAARAARATNCTRPHRGSCDDAASPLTYCDLTSIIKQRAAPLSPRRAHTARASGGGRGRSPWKSQECLRYLKRLSLITFWVFCLRLSACNEPQMGYRRSHAGRPPPSAPSAQLTSKAFVP
ncbi:hypothetical protein EVAR_13143_1 [Eumeta japonica]|uniref:Uncharacterized protein n=1 Tax=Eumeta variegata TaxID=151549 RepID=A0A4C1U9R2_EUMVA|nr:hypothetical protein EVAR_13143_1 [Eumeta japonica]